VGGGVGGLMMVMVMVRVGTLGPGVLTKREYLPILEQKGC